MEIKNYTSAINAYRYASESASRPTAGKTQKNKGRNTDKAEFSVSARASFSDTLKTAAKAVADSSASAERLAELSAQIADGSYRVSSEDIADSILGL
ncbi:flagellar biosynthesis anti-sigma factor FlgM [Huintestinicola sp.]|uniref:flagellar biosynthesis anti-sigma factor FlgM n=1 Tax=Huintestinicola sp. TaxID=2981661 RepID=UPI003D7D4D54